RVTLERGLFSVAPDVEGRIVPRFSHGVCNRIVLDPMTAPGPIGDADGRTGQGAKFVVRRSDAAGMSDVETRGLFAEYTAAFDKVVYDCAGGSGVACIRPNS